MAGDGGEGEREGEREKEGGREGPGTFMIGLLSVEDTC